MTTPLTAEDPPLVGSFRLISRFSVDVGGVTYLAASAGGNDVLLTLYAERPAEAELEGALRVRPFGLQLCVVRPYAGPALPKKRMRTARIWDLKVVGLWVLATFAFCALTVTVWMHFVVTEKPLTPPFFTVSASASEARAWVSPDGREVLLRLTDGDACPQKAEAVIEERPDALTLTVRVNNPDCSEDRFPVVVSVPLAHPLGDRRLMGPKGKPYTSLTREPKERRIELVSVR
ncbi:hypothetical protein GCM10027589_23250 [Actinocorallia lasiicapitis]